MALSASSQSEKPAPVKVIEVKTVGAYEVAVLSTKDSGALENWLAANHFYFPTNKTNALDAYVKQQWYFVAAKIRVGKSDRFHLATESPKGSEARESSYSTRLKLVSGELHPLQISFASDRCVYPLKVSSINDRPTEVQLYVLSPQPLLEKAMFEKKQAEVVRSEMERWPRLEQSKRNLEALRLGIWEAAWFPSAVTNNHLDFPPEVAWWDLLPYGKVMEKELPQCSKSLLRLKGKTWWLTKQTWTFQPAEMRDLEFQAAVPVLTKKLNSKEGYFAAANLASLGTEGATALLSALHETNTTAQLNAASVLERIDDPRLVGQLDTLLTDPQPEIRAHAILVATGHWNSKFSEKLIGLLCDPYREIRREADFALAGHPDDLSRYLPVFERMFADTNLNARVSGMKMLWRLRKPIPREQLLQFFKLSDLEAISLVLAQLRNENNSGIPHFINYGAGISDTEAVPLLQNPEPLARLIGLRVLYEKAETQSVELALPLLKDPEPLVRMRAAATLRAFSGLHFTEDQADQWQAWWTANKTNFVVELHPEELRPQRRGTNDLQQYLTNRPPAIVP